MTTTAERTAATRARPAEADVADAVRGPATLTHETWRGRALTPVLVSVGILVAVVSSLGAPLVPTIAVDYGVTLADAQWTLTVTLLVGALVAPVVGRLGDGPRRRPVLLAALGVLVVGSALAAVPGLPFAVLVTGRALQGVGLALLPLAMGIARDHLPDERARTTLASLSVTTVVGVGLGYPLTGLIAEHLSFHTGFVIAAALGALAMVAVAVVVPDSRHRPAQPFDGAGAALLGIGVAALVLAVSEGEAWGWASPRLLALAAAAVVVLAVCVRHELRTGHPVVDLRLMSRRTVLTANVTAALAGVGMYVLMSMVIRFVQTPTATGYGLGESTVVSGLVLLPLSVASYVATRFVSRLGGRLQPVRILPVGALLFGLALAVFATSRGSLWELLVIMGIAGLGTGSSFSVLPRLIVGAVPADATSSALALNQLFRTVGFAVGSAASATVLTAHTAAGSRFPSDRGYTVGAVAAIGLCVVTAVVSVALQGRGTSASAAGPRTASATGTTTDITTSTITDTTTDTGSSTGRAPGRHRARGGTVAVRR